MRDTTLIDALKSMENDDAVDDIDAVNDFIKDFIEYMDDKYDIEQDEIMYECGLVYMRGR